MIIVYLIFWIYAFAGCKVRSFNAEYCSKQNTDFIKGLFVFLVLCRHFAESVSNDSMLNEAFSLITKVIGQLMVGGFLFYSGYGVTTSYKIKGKKYIEKFPRHNILKVLIDFDIAVMIFLLYGLLVGHTYSVKQILLSFIGYESVGNSNWYVFACLVSYIVFLIACSLFKDNWQIAIMLFMSIIYSIVINLVKEDYWFNTFFCFLLGVMFAQYKAQIDQILSSKKLYWVLHIICLILFALSTAVRYINVVFYIFSSVLFSMYMVLLTVKLQLKHKKFIVWMGTHSFSIYILQRMPMHFFSNIVNIKMDLLRFVIVCISTVAMVCVFDVFTKKLSSRFNL